MTPLDISPWIGIAVVIVLMFAMLGGLRVLQSQFKWHPESMRKLAHVGLGLAWLSFPFVFRDVWPVLLLGGLAVVMLSALRWVPFIRRQIGGVVHGVERNSGGDLYFPIAATTLFVMAHDTPLLYGIPVITLTAADAVAALVGVNYGRTHFGEEDGRKSFEGSLAFFVVAFLASHIPLLLFTQTGRAESLLIGLTMGVLLMLLEAASLRGLDNLFIPLGGFLLLRTFITLDAGALATRLAVIVFLVAFVLTMRRSKSLGDNAMLAGVLIAYTAWSAGGWHWLLPPLILFVLYNVAFPRNDQLREHPHRMVAVFGVTATGLLWLLLSSMLKRPEFYYPYTVAFAASLCSRGINWYRDYRRRASTTEVMFASSAISWLIFFAPYLAISGLTRIAITASLLAFLPIFAGAALQVVFVPHIRNRADDEYPWPTQVAISVAISALGLWLWHMIPTT